MRKARFIAVDPHWREYDEAGVPKSYAIPSAGLAYVIASVKDEGGEITGVEQFFTEKSKRPLSLEQFHKEREKFIDNVLDKAVRDNCDAILLTMTNGAYHHVLRFLEKSKDLNIKIIIGGSFITLTSLIPEYKDIMLRKSSCPDIITVEGEGEQAIRTITRRIIQGRGFEGIPGVALRKNGSIVGCQSKAPRYDISDLIVADYSDFDLSKMGPSLLVSRSRGCPASCLFCDERDVFRGYRLMPDARVLKELRTFLTAYNVRTFKWTDSSFTAREKDVIGTCQAIIDEGLNNQMQWLAYARIKEVKRFDDTTLDLMKKAGCAGLHYGFETFDECLLNRVKKGYNSLEEAQEVVRRTKDAGIKITGSFMSGFPQQTEEALWNSIEHSINLKLDVYNIHAAVPPVRQMEAPDEYGVDPTFRIWNNDPNIPPNLFSEYTLWHLDEYGVPDTLGRHTTSKQILVGLKPEVQRTAYKLEYSAETLVKSLEIFMANGRESIEYDLFFREPDARAEFN